MVDVSAEGPSLYDYAAFPSLLPYYEWLAQLTYPIAKFEASPSILGASPLGS